MSHNLPPPWEAGQDDEGHWYWINHDTEETTYDDPRWKILPEGWEEARPLTVPRLFARRQNTPSLAGAGRCGENVLHRPQHRSDDVR